MKKEPVLKNADRFFVNSDIKFSVCLCDESWFSGILQIKVNFLQINAIVFFSFMPLLF